jgi:tripartite ATP-independent transporter DctM subunit
MTPRFLISAARKFFHHTENAVAVLLLLLVALFPALEVLVRLFLKTGVHASADYVQHIVLWITFVGGMITTRDRKHLSVSLGVDLLKEPWTSRIRTITSLLSVAVGSVFTWSAVQYVQTSFDPAQRVGLFPVQWVMAVMPVGFAVMTLRFVTQAPRGVVPKLLAASGIVVAVLLGWAGPERMPAMVWPCAIALVAGSIIGTPIFVVLGGLAAVFFQSTGSVMALIPNQAYTMLTGPIIPTIPLFTLAGFILSESKAGERLVALFRATFGWLPGGLAAMAIIVCAFFTTFTGASGVTILALGGLLSYMMLENRYPKGFTTGLLTASGSIGLLFAPSLPLILYGVVAQVNIKHMFIGGLLPGILMVLTLVIMGVITGAKSRVEKFTVRPQEVLSSGFRASGEMLLPVAIVLSFFGGITTIVETGALAAAYSLILVLVVHRDFSVRHLPSVLLKCIPVISGVLIILALANALSYYIIDAEIPTALADWCKAHIHSKYVFLIALNVALLIVGCFMDIFSATTVVVPLILPLAALYGIHPVHLGIIFLANLELGYLTPPVGLNLFLSSYRFEMPITRVYKHVMPFLAALIATVLLITYVPGMSTWLLDVIHL